MPKMMCTALALILMDCGMAVALPLDRQAVAPPPITLVANGCGRGMFRTIDGECLPNRQVHAGPHRGTIEGPPCPRGYLRDPDPARPLCYPVY